jgi:hypothetical protein
MLAGNPAHLALTTNELRRHFDAQQSDFGFHLLSCPTLVSTLNEPAG